MLFVSSTQACKSQLDRARLCNRGHVYLHVQSVIEVTFAVLNLLEQDHRVDKFRYGDWLYFVTTKDGQFCRYSHVLYRLP